MPSKLYTFENVDMMPSVGIFIHVPSPRKCTFATAADRNVREDQVYLEVYEPQYIQERALCTQSPLSSPVQ